MLYRDALVMYDRETLSLWSQIGGRAIRGPLRGQTLQPLPSVHATWKEWKTLYHGLEERSLSRSDESQCPHDPPKIC